jgi:uncharacterized protein YndB with AHSA1/START domain
MNNSLFERSFSRRINAPLEKTWQAWAALWSVWVQMNMSNDFRKGGSYNNGMGEGGEYIEIVPQKTISFTWQMKRYQPVSSIEVRFVPEGPSCTICTLTHKNLQCESDAADAELGWNWAMDSLQSFLEEGKALSWEQWEEKNKQQNIS